MAYCCLVLAQGSEEESRLIQHLLVDYHRAARPVVNHTDAVKVQFGLGLVRIDRVTEVPGGVQVRLLVWERRMWKDAYLQWNPEDYKNINAQRLDIDKIWKPDITGFNLGPGDIVREEALAVITNDGSVLQIPKTYINDVTCPEIDAGVYVCKLKYGSWTYDGFQIELGLYEDRKSLDLTDFQPNPIVEVVNTTLTWKNMYYPCCIEPYPSITATIMLRKHSDDSTGWTNWLLGY